MKVEKNEQLSEKFSEKKRRGRPRLLPPYEEAAYRRSMPARDIRTLQNKDYQVRAMRVLGLNKINTPDCPFSWLGDISKMDVNVSEQRFFRKTILCELGRIYGDLSLIKAATEICRLKPETQDAVKMIRGWRLKKTVAPVSFDSTLRKTIDDYKNQHPDVTDNEIYEILTSLADEYFQRALFGID